MNQNKLKLLVGAASPVSRWAICRSPRAPTDAFRIGVALSVAMLSAPTLAQESPAAAGDVAREQRAQAQSPVERANPDTAVTPASAGSQLEEIVVTGRKRARAEALQNVPISITALSAAQLQRTTTRDLVDVGRITPNASLQPSSQRGVQNFSIRGTGVSGTTPSDEPAVGIFQDGIYWGSNYGALNELLDLEGVEILRGPQGTLFGRNVTGGAVAVRSARPSATPYNRVTLGISNGLGLDASAVVNGGLTETVSARVALLSRYTDGLFTNINNDTSYGKSHTKIVRPSIRWKPSSNFDITLLGEYYGQDGDPTPVRGISPRTIGATPNLAERAGFVTSEDFSEIQVGDRGFADVDVYLGVLDANLQIGPGTLTSITGYRKVSSRNQTDFDGFPVAGFLQFVETDQHQWSEELRYAADLSDWLSMTAGLYYFDQRLSFLETRNLNNGATRVATRSFLDNTSYAAFAEADLEPIEGLTITLGGRYTHETKKPRAAPFGSCPFNLASPCTFTTRDEYKGNNFSPKVGLAYEIDRNILVFASWTRGFRSGGFSLRGTPLGAPYDAETVDAYEAGFKTDLLSNRLRFNASAYYNSFNDLQRTVLGVDPILGVVQSVFNAADATVKGFELELTAVPVTGLTLSATYGYTDASYETFLGFANPENLEFVRVPKHTGNVAIEYERRFDAERAAGFRLGGSYTGRYFFDDPNLISQDDYWLVDAKAYYNFSRNLSLELYARNLTNTQYNFWGSTLGALGENRFPGEPRMYGGRISVSF